jgi:hypothetical protein
MSSIDDRVSNAKRDIEKFLHQYGSKLSPRCVSFLEKSLDAPLDAMRREGMRLAEKIPRDKKIEVLIDALYAGDP